MAKVNDKNSTRRLSGVTNQMNVIGMAPMMFMWSVEMLTVERFAERMDISEGTVWAWIKGNALKKHRHFFQKGKIIRFPWGPELIKALMEDGLFDLVEEETADMLGYNSDTAVLQADGIVNDLIVASDSPAIIPHVATQHKSSKPFGDVLPIASEGQQPIKVAKSSGRKRRSFSGCPINPDLLK